MEIQRNRTLRSELTEALEIAEGIRGRVELTKAGGEFTAILLSDSGNGRAFVGQARDVGDAVRRMNDDLNGAIQVHMAKRRNG